jgi:two-component system response regulator DesR
VLLVEDPPLTRRGFAALLRGETDIVVVGEYPFDSVDAESPVARAAARLRPDVVVVNTDYMVSQILPLAADLRAHHPACAVLVLSDPGKKGMLPPRRRSRGLNFLVRDVPVALLAATIRRVAAGEPVIHPRLAAATLGTEKTVTTRELEILGLAADGASVADIARRLYLSLGTVRNHLSSAITKTGARNRIDAIRIVRRDGWLR